MKQIKKLTKRILECDIRARIPFYCSDKQYKYVKREILHNFKCNLIDYISYDEYDELKCSCSTGKVKYSIKSKEIKKK